MINKNQQKSLQQEYMLNKGATWIHNCRVWLKDMLSDGEMSFIDLY